MVRAVVIRILIFGALIGPCYGAVGQSAFEFMLLDSGSRAASMGEAFTALSGDVGAPYFNPATAALLTGHEVSFAHIAYLRDVSIEEFAVVSASNNFRFGGSLSLGKVSDIERRDTTPSGSPLGTFDEHNVTASFFWGIPATDKLSIGNSLKFAYEKLDLQDASALAVDLGGLYSLTKEISVGASLRNFGTRPKFVDTGFDLPMELRLGVSYQKGDSYPVYTLAADYIKPEWGDKSSKLNVGGEYNYQNLAYLRAGGFFGYDSRTLSVGGGISYRNYNFDYAFVPTKHNLGNTHRLTLRIRI